MIKEVTEEEHEKAWRNGNRVDILLIRRQVNYKPCNLLHYNQKLYAFTKNLYFTADTIEEAHAFFEIHYHSFSNGIAQFNRQQKLRGLFL
jgi:hypothetical protein